MSNIETVSSPRTWLAETPGNEISLQPGNMPAAWKTHEKILFRFFFIYLVIQAVPLDWKFYRDLFSINWSQIHFYPFFRLTQYSPQFFSAGQLGRWGLASYANWGVAF